MELLETNNNLFFGVITAVFQSVDELFVVGGRRGKGHVVDLSGLGIGSASNDTFHQDFVGNVEEQEAIGGTASFGKGLGLGGGSRESIEQPTLFLAIGFLETITDDTDDDLVGDEFSAVHVFLGLNTDFGSGGDSGTKHVSGRQVDNTEFLLDNFTLGALSTGRSTGDDDVYGTAGRGIVRRGFGVNSSSFQPFLLLLPLGCRFRAHFEDKGGLRRGCHDPLAHGMSRWDGKESRSRGDGRQGDEQDC
mmetsp:Transcript_21294/g.43795  ORF Transcript_21294/g.43795 Transcript_21294/m.43795 type:complete len:248 (+) Transcript_21294:315-1058(+)